jgi:hypothetical protein
MTIQRQSYTVQLTPINPSVASASGGARIIADNNNAGFYVDMNGVTSLIPHAQTIHSGSICPGLDADKNQDGIVDETEAEIVVGPAAVPLTLTLNQDLQGGGSIRPLNFSNFPVADSSGSYEYLNIGSLSAIQNALKTNVAPSPSASPTMMPSDMPMASPSVSPSPGDTTPTGADPYGLSEHVILIHGIGPGANLPNTVTAPNGENPASAIPVACGVITLTSGQ